MKPTWLKLIFSNYQNYSHKRAFILWLLREWDIDVDLFYVNVCPFCRREFGSVQALKIHLRYCKGFKHHMALAEQVYREALALIERPHHKRQYGKYYCRECYRYFDNKLEALKHVYKFHLSKKIL